MRCKPACLAAVVCLLVLIAPPSGAQGPTPGHGGPLGGAPATYADDFSDPGSGWAVWSGAESSGAYDAGAFVLTVTASNWAAWSVNPTLPPVDDFRAEVDATLQQGAPQNSLGLAVRLTDDLNLYTFEISGQGRFRITRLQDGKTTVLSPWTPSSAILPAPAPNRLAVTCVGSRLAFAVNGRELRRVSDATFAAGAVGLYAARLDSGGADVRAAFSNLMVAPGESATLLPDATAAPVVVPTPTRGRLVQNTPIVPTPQVKVVVATATPAAPAATAKRPPAKTGGGFAGAWQTNFGLMTLTVKGLSVDGTYTDKNGNIMAALSPDGRTITGTWDQDPSHNPPDDAGRMVFHLSADGQSWTGTWGYGTDESGYNNGGEWTGNRVGSAPAPPPTATAAPQPPRPKPGADFAGTWQTDFGLMTLTVDGFSVDGKYEYKNGNVIGALSPDGRTFTGAWDQDPSHNPPNDMGRLIFRLSADGQSWAGTWGYGQAAGSYDNGGTWTGTRVGSALAPPPAAAGLCQAKPVPGKWVVYFTLTHGQPYMCFVDKEGHPPVVPSPNNPLTLTGLNPSVGDHIRLQTDGVDKQRFFNLMWDCGTNPGAFSPCDFWSSSLWDLQEEIVVNQAGQIGTLNLSHYDNWAGVRSGFEPRRYPGDPDFRLMVESR